MYSTAVIDFLYLESFKQGRTEHSTRLYPTQMFGINFSMLRDTLCKRGFSLCFSSLKGLSLDVSTLGAFDTRAVAQM
jgi:hypothetical protein